MAKISGEIHHENLPVGISQLMSITVLRRTQFLCVQNQQVKRSFTATHLTCLYVSFLFFFNEKQKIKTQQCRVVE